MNSRIIQLPKIADPLGNLSIIEQLKQIPFEIKRTYWVYDVPGGCNRGGHAYKENEEFIVALSGAFFKAGDSQSLADCISKWFSEHVDDREKVRQYCYEVINTKWNPHNQIKILKEVLTNNN